MKLPIKLGINLLSAVPKIKSWIFADGKFTPVRALILLAFLIVIMLGYNYLGIEETNMAVEALDEASDVIGYGG